ncbi:hypothetical protein BDV33DRAFT_21972 [Aspergillus novoparasiticus]|uniref:Uncharacterized protein n=1 Tax=Aspergillus novoparasiticus TaxID=986946 RepID=A0A5N6ECF7_9EURO|nr:hypothetical protein BDV33DRAFT_21972 [Aspergillus novoparasiticus]
MFFHGSMSSFVFITIPRYLFVYYHNDHPGSYDSNYSKVKACSTRCRRFLCESGSFFTF